MSQKYQMTKLAITGGNTLFESLFWCSSRTEIELEFQNLSSLVADRSASCATTTSQQFESLGSSCCGSVVVVQLLWFSCRGTVVVVQLVECLLPKPEIHHSQAFLFTVVSTKKRGWAKPISKNSLLKYYFTSHLFTDCLEVNRLNIFTAKKFLVVLRSRLHHRHGAEQSRHLSQGSYVVRSSEEGIRSGYDAEQDDTGGPRVHGGGLMFRLQQNFGRPEPGCSCSSGLFRPSVGAFGANPRPAVTIATGQIDQRWSVETLK